MTIRIENRPIRAGSYSQKTLLQGSNVTLQQAQNILKALGISGAIRSGGQGMIGLWRWLDPSRPGQIRYNTTPPRQELWNTLKPEFSAGAGLAFVPDGSPYVTAIYNGFILQENIQTPANWIPKTTILNAQGTPISETSTTGQTVNLISGAGTGQAAFQNGAFQPGFQAIPADIQNGGFGDQDFDNIGPMQAIGQFQPVQAALPLVTVPLLIKGGLLVGGLVLAYFGARKLWAYVKEIYFTYVYPLYQQIKNAANIAYNKAKGAGVLLPVAALLAAATVAYVAYT